MEKFHRKALSHFQNKNKLATDHLKSQAEQWKNTEEFIIKRKLQPVDRKKLIKQLEIQYKRSALKNKNVSRLISDDTFTVTTGHQLNLFTGPSFFIYKIINTINYAQTLKAEYPKYDFIPVFWMASEDHDFDEIASTNILHHNYNWENSLKGAVGRMTVDEIQPLIAALNDNLSGGKLDDVMIHWLKNAYQTGRTLADATRILVHELFQNTDLIIIDGDDKELKASFEPIMREELLNSPTRPLVVERNKQLEKNDYHTQVHARAINLFYLSEGIRARIVNEDGTFKAVGTDHSWSQDEILAELSENPQKFSPNALLRPVYQEVILPNIAYIGGAGEVSYWQQLDKVFEHFRVPYPQVWIRNSVWWLDEKWIEKLNKLKLQVDDVWILEDNELMDSIIKAKDEEFNTSLYKNELNQLMSKLESEVAAIDGSLKGKVGAAKAGMMKELTDIEKRVIKSQKDRHEIDIRQVLKIKALLYPDDLPQERYENFMSFNLRFGDDFFDVLYEHLDVRTCDAYLFVP